MANSDGSGRREICLAWQNLTISIRDWTNYSNCFRHKTILNNVSGHFCVGTLNGLMGPSGSGKTTLLKCFTGSISASTSSNFYISSNESSKTFYFIPQHVQCTIFGQLTVHQILRYAYWFKNGITSGSKVINQHICRVMDELLLNNDILKRQFSCCSGGEQKRIAIAQELMSINKPAFLFVDEPTTGLDSNAAFIVMKCLKSLTERYRMSVIVSIHVPNQETLELFDKLYVMAKGGVCVYSGPPSNIEQSLQKHINIELTSQQQPIEELIKIACKGVKNKDTATLANRCNLLQVSELTGRTHKMTSLSHFALPASPKFFSPIDFLLHLRRTFDILFISGFKSFIGVLAAILLKIIFIASIFGTEMTKPDGCHALPLGPVDSNQTDNALENWLHCQRDMASQPLLYENINFLITASSLQQFVVSLLTLIIFRPLMNVFISEYQNRWYSLYVFVFSSTLFTFIHLAICQLVFISIAFAVESSHYETLDLHRLSHFTLANLLILFINVSSSLCITLLISKNDIAVIVIAIATNACVSLNDFYFKTDRSEYEFIGQTANIVGQKYFVRYLIFIFYGFDRCKHGTETSFIVDEFDIDPEDIETYIKVLLNIGASLLLLMCFLSYLCFYRFVWLRRLLSVSRSLSPFSSSPSLSFSSKNRTLVIHSLSPFDRKVNLSRKSLNYSVNMFNMEDAEEKFNQFSQNKTLIAWENVTLYTSSPFYAYCSSSSSTSNSLFSCSSQSSSCSPPSSTSSLPPSPRSSISSNQSSPKTASPNLSFPSSSSSISSSSSSLGRRSILHNVSGSFQYGTLNALMGVSGAGKTSLLRVLNGQYKDRLSPNSKFFLTRFSHIRSCFLTQDVGGHLWSGLTVRQSLLYAAKLHNCHDSKHTNDDELQTIDNECIAQGLLEELNMVDIANTQVQHCSGGEQKRLALAQELTAIKMPNLVCIDEPTSGLDSNSSEVVISCLRFFAKKRNICIIASIHQPSMDIMSMIDKLYVLARGGYTIYSGLPDGLVDHLNFLSCLETRVQYKTAIEELIKHSCSSPAGSRIISTLNNSHCEHFSSIEKVGFESDVQVVPDGIPTTQTRFSLLSVRFLLERYYHLLVNHLWAPLLLFFTMSITFIYFLTLLFRQQIAEPSGCYDLAEIDFNNTCTKSDEFRQSEQEVRTSFMYLFFSSYLLLIFLMLQNCVILFQEQFNYYNEHRNGWYSAGSFYITKSLVDFVLSIPLIALYIYIFNIYEPVRSGIYWNFLWISILCALYIQGFGHLIVWLSGKSFMSLILYCSVFLTTGFLFNNFLVNVRRLHYVYQFLSKLSISRHSLEALVLLVYGFGRCDGRETQLMLKYMNLSDPHFHSTIVMILLNIFFVRLAAFYLQLRCSRCPHQPNVRIKRILDHLQTIRSQ